MDYSGNDSVVAPQFKTWFYIYKPNTVRDEFRQLIMDEYLVEAKDIEKFDYEFGSVRTEQEVDTTNAKDILEFEDLKHSNADKNGDIEGFDTLKIADDETSVRDAIADYDNLDKDEKSKVSKFDKEVDDKQYVEKSEIPMDTTETFEETTTVSEESGPEKFVLPLKKFFTDDSMEMMVAQENNRNFVNGVN